MQIKELEIFTPNLRGQVEFYERVLELKCLSQSDSSATFEIGSTILRISARDEFIPYHYAINIPSNQEQEALAWLKERVEVLLDEGSEIQHFDFWDAYAVYFYDADCNIVEFIARRTLERPSEKSFSSASLLHISEIGLPTRSIEKEWNTLQKVADLDIYSGSIERFCAIGNEEGLFIVLNQEKKKEWYPTGDFTRAADFKIRIQEKGKDYDFQQKDGKLIAL